MRWLLPIPLYAQSFPMVVEDICEQLNLQGESAIEDFTEELMQLSLHPIALNHTSADELRVLRFLSEEQIDAILLYAYTHTFHSTAELQLIPELQDYEIRNLLPFVVVDEGSEPQKVYPNEVFRYAQHEITLRTDARNIESAINDDPFYGKLRYRFNYKKKAQAGFTILRPTGLSWNQVQYGCYLQLNDIGPVQTLVLGNYQASFGQGLVVGTPFHISKSSYVLSSSSSRDGIRKFSSVGDDYEAFHGIGTTVRTGGARISAWYSLQQVRTVWHHAFGANIDYEYRQLKVGVTVLENLYSDSTDALAVLGAHVRYNRGIVDVWSEVAASQSALWGWGTLTGVRLTPITNVGLVALYRYYSPTFNSPYGNSFSTHTYLRDENGFYMGVECTRLPHWRFSGYGDGWREGFDCLLQTDWNPCETYTMLFRFRAKQRDLTTTYSARYQFDFTHGGWHLRTQADANGVQTDGQWSYGVSVFQNVDYSFQRVPIVLQARLQGFDARQWNNRIYIYENDVLYAYSIPYVYGLGARFWLNARYNINEMFSLYLKWSETYLSPNWASAHNRNPWRSDVHFLLRVKI